MKWNAQVAHVVRKDLYLSRWILLAYALVVLGTTAAAVGGDALGAESGPPWTLLLVLLGMILLALLVQADSPQRSDAFWVTLPLHRSAVFAAKVAGAILFLLVLPLVGQLAGLSAHAVAAGDLPVLLVRSALVYGAWLGLAAVVAALTPDLRTFVVALLLVLVGGLVGVQVLGALVAGPAPTSASPARLLGPAMIVGGALFVLAHQYRTRNVGRGARIAALLGIAILALSLATGRSAPAAHPASGRIPDSLRPASLDLGDVRFQGGGDATLEFQLRGVSASHQYLLVSPVVHLHMPDGSAEPLELHFGDPHVGLNAPNPRLAERLTWLGERVPPREFTTGVPLDLTPDQRAALARGDARLSVRAHLEVREARARADLPLETGATAVFDGQRVRVLEVENSGENPTVTLRVSSVEASTPMHDRSGRAIRYALVSRDSHEAIALREGSGSRSSSGLVLPGARAWTGTQALQQDVSDVRVGDVWLRSARLLLMDWVPVGSAPVVIEGTPSGADLQRRRGIDVAR